MTIGFIDSLIRIFTNLSNMDLGLFLSFILLFGYIFITNYRELRNYRIINAQIEMFNSRLIPIKHELMNNYRNKIISTEIRCVDNSKVCLRQDELIKFNDYANRLLIKDIIEVALSTLKRIAKENNIPKLGSYAFHDYCEEKFNELYGKVIGSLSDGYSDDIFIIPLKERIKTAEENKEEYYKKFVNAMETAKRISKKGGE